MFVTKLRNKYMKVRQEILDKVNNPTSRTRIALDLGVGEQVIAIHMRRNARNGRLTKYDALNAISKEAEVTVDQILEESNEEVTKS